MCTIDPRILSMKKTLALLTATGAAVLALNVQAATKWDLPSAYPASNLHTENLEQFVKDVSKLSNGELQIRSEERRVGKEGRERWSRERGEKKTTTSVGE